MNNIQAASDVFRCGSPIGTRHLTVRYVVMVIVLGVLQVGTYFILRAEIEISHSLGAVYAETANQRSLLQGSSTLSGKLVGATQDKQRNEVRSQLKEMIASLEKTHKDLLREESDKQGLPQVARAIYFDPPWLFDGEFNKYVTELRALAEAPDDELSRENPHFQNIRVAAMSGRMVDALNRIALAYQKSDDEKADFLQWLAIWAAGSTILVLVLSVMFVFRPMARRVKQDIDLLWRLKGNLERLLAERSTLAEKHANSLAISEALYRSLVDNSSLKVNRKDLEGRFTFVNDSFCKYLGKSREEIIGKTNFDFLPADAAEKYQRYEKQIIDQGGIVRSVEPAHSADGTVGYVEVLKAPVKDANGEITEIQTVFLDVTERMEAARNRA